MTPEQLVSRALDLGVKALALTDHDTVAGVARFLAAGRERRLQAIAGVEISIEFQPGTMHMLGYLMDPSNGALEDALSRLRNGRRDRNGKMMEKLSALGLPLAREEVESFAGEEVVGRLHFAQALAAKGYVGSTQEAFDRYLGKGKPGYADRYRLTAKEAISLIRSAGGVPVLAHPSTLGLKHAELKRILGELSDGGLQGVEVYYSEHSADQVREYRRMAREFKLVGTGGSDFHGSANPAIEMGRGFGSLSVPDEVVDELEERAR